VKVNFFRSSVLLTGEFTLFFRSSIGIVQIFISFSKKGSNLPTRERFTFCCHEVRYFQIWKFASVANFYCTSSWCVVLTKLPSSCHLCFSSISQTVCPEVQYERVGISLCLAEKSSYCRVIHFKYAESSVVSRMKIHFILIWKTN
jgi:hypothetical protein